MNTLPQPPTLIKVNTDFSAGLDLRKPIEAAAYLKAASHFLSGWPQDWSAERLCLAMIDEESTDKSKVLLWETITKDMHPMDDPYLYVEEFINGLAEDFMMFLAEQSNQ